MFYTLAEAAKAVGRTKPALLHAIKKGTLSARKTEFGTWEVDPSELMRVYKPAKNKAVNDDVAVATLTAEKEAEINVLKTRLEVMEELVSTLRSDKEKAERREDEAARREADLRRDIERWQALTFDAQQRLKALEAPKAGGIIDGNVQQAGQTQPQKKGFFRRLFG